MTVGVANKTWLVVWLGVVVAGAGLPGQAWAQPVDAPREVEVSGFRTAVSALSWGVDLGVVGADVGALVGMAIARGSAHGAEAPIGMVAGAAVGLGLGLWLGVAKANNTPLFVTGLTLMLAGGAVAGGFAYDHYVLGPRRGGGGGISFGLAPLPGGAGVSLAGALPDWF